jgi:ribosomal protein S12 methylthiotransferase accessory factor YcaO
MEVRLAPDVDIFLVDRTLLMHRRGCVIVRFSATPSALTAVARLSGASLHRTPGTTGDGGRVQEMVTSALDKAGLLEPTSRPSAVSIPLQDAGYGVPRLERAHVRRMPADSGHDAEAAEPVLFMVESWADLVLLDPSDVPAGRPWAVCRLRADTVQISSLLKLPEPTMCWDCLRGRLLGHDDLLRAIWPRLSSGTCARLTTGAMPSEGTTDLVRSVLRSVAADARPGIVQLGIGEEAGTFHPVLPYATCQHGHRCDRTRRSSAGSGRCPDLPMRLARARGRLEPLVGPITGLIEPARTVTDLDLPIHVATARYADASGEGSTVAVRPNGSITHDSGLQRDAFGSGLTAAQATVRAALEGLERYCSVQQSHDPILSRGQGLPNHAHLCPDRGVVVAAGPDIGCCAEQEWVLCTPLEGASVVAVPAVACYHRQMRPAASGCTGMALGETREDAVVTGFLEYLEREAINKWWRRGLRAGRVPLDLVEDELVEVTVSYHRDRGRSLFALRVPSPMPGTEVVIAVSSLSQRGFPLLGMGAGFTLTTAVAKALREVGQALAFERTERRKWASMPRPAMRWLADQAAARFIASDDWASAVVPAADELARVADLSRVAGRTPLVLDYQRPEVPFACVRVLIPPVLGDELVVHGPVPGARWGELPW